MLGLQVRSTPLLSTDSARRDEFNCSGDHATSKSTCPCNRFLRLRHVHCVSSLLRMMRRHLGGEEGCFRSDMGASPCKMKDTKSQALGVGRGWKRDLPEPDRTRSPCLVTESPLEGLPGQCPAGNDQFRRERQHWHACCAPFRCIGLS